MEKLFYGLTPEDKALITDHFVETKYEGDLSDYLLNGLKQGILNAQRTILSGKWQQNGATIDIPQESLEKIQIPREDLTVKGQTRGVLIFYPAMLKGLQDWYKLQKFLDNAFGVKEGIKSLDHFVQEFVRGNVIEIKLQHFTKQLEKEEADAKKAKESA